MTAMQRHAAPMQPAMQPHSLGDSVNAEPADATAPCWTKRKLWRPWRRSRLQEEEHATSRPTVLCSQCYVLLQLVQYFCSLAANPIGHFAQVEASVARCGSCMSWAHGRAPSSARPSASASACGGPVAWLIILSQFLRRRSSFPVGPLRTG